MMKLLDVTYPKTEKTEQMINRNVEYYKDHQAGDIHLENEEYQLDEVRMGHAIHAGCCVQFKTLLWRNFSQIKKNPLAFKGRVIQVLVIFLLALGCFQTSSGDSWKEQANMGGAMFFLCVSYFMNNYVGTTIVF